LGLFSQASDSPHVRRARPGASACRALRAVCMRRCEGLRCREPGFSSGFSPPGARARHRSRRAGLPTSKPSTGSGVSSGGGGESLTAPSSSSFSRRSALSRTTTTT
jgi:hypothetical protein